MTTRMIKIRQDADIDYHDGDDNYDNNDANDVNVERPTIPNTNAVINDKQDDGDNDNDDDDDQDRMGT